jgi:molybdopterin-guanine dinucleotide biosynthesis protein A
MDENTELVQFKETEIKEEQTKSRTAVVLAGGRGRRMGLVEKAFIEIEGKTIINRLLESLFLVVDEVILSVRDSIQKEMYLQALDKLSDLEIRFCFDTLEDAGPLEGIRVGLLESKSEYSFVCAGDMPFINSNVVNLLFEKATGHDAVLPGWEYKKFEPLHAVYSTRLIPEIEKSFVKGKHSVLASVFEMEDVVVIDVSEIRKLNPELNTFTNLNTIEDMKFIMEDFKNSTFFE